MNRTALIAMSGGVDSSVAAHLMKTKGFDCTGIIMKMYGEVDVDDAQSVSDDLGIFLNVCDFTAEFKEHVIDRFAEAYQNCETPNPCVICNRHIKFKKLFDFAKGNDIECIVTGHYARVEFDETSNRYLLKKAVDETKDQSYVLFSLTQKQLKHTVFPLGEMCKSEIRAIALAQGFVNANKRDSQDICFVNDGDYAGFIEKHTNKTYAPGNFIDSQGNVLGRHNGLIRYTIGQRKGLGLALAKPMYVCSKNLSDNTVTLCENHELFSKSLNAVDFNWIAFDKPEKPIRVKAKVRYNQTEQWATAEQTSGGAVHVKFDEPQRAIAKGQVVVLYDGDSVVGGGTIN